jgi:hypothetical protein
MKTAIELKNFDHTLWIAKLKNYKSEIVSLESKLEEIAARSTKPEILAKVEHFQNQFIVQKSNVNDIIHALKMDEKNYRYEMIMNRNELGRKPSEDPKEKDLAETFEKTMKELKSEFEKFVLRGK